MGRGESRPHPNPNPNRNPHPHPNPNQAILREIRGKPPLPAYVRPLRLTAVSLGKWDGVVVLARWVAMRGWLAALSKQLIQWYFVHFLPLPYWLLRRLPGSQPRKPPDVVPRASTQ